MSIFGMFIAMIRGTHYECGGKWRFLRRTLYGHWDKCDRCGAESYETDY